VLLAEDNEVNAYLFSAMLADEAVHIDTAPNGLEALALLRSQRYHIAYIDVQMPGLDGLSLTRELRRWERAQGRVPLPVVSLTANAFASDVQASLEAGSQMHLAKPFSKAALIDSLHRLALPAQQASGASAAPEAPESHTTAEPRLLQAGVSAGTLAHARVFLQDWPSALARAQAAGDRAQMQELAADLQGVAARLGAQALQAAAQELVDTLASAETWPDAGQRALREVQQALVPVMMALREPPA
jgi:CheY-like chemotaxis protein